MLVANRDWLETTTFARAVDATLPLGKIYLPDSSYREMTEWALPPESLRALIDGRATARRLAGLGRDQAVLTVPADSGATSRRRYPESDEMYARMLGVSRRLAAVERGRDADPDYLEIARQELYRGQCNCPYWHGSFGGLYLPHLRNAIYRRPDHRRQRPRRRRGARPGLASALEVGDFNLDARQEVRLENDRLIALVRPAQGGHIYELDVRESATNVLATLDRRPEAYHADILAAAAADRNGQDAPDTSGRPMRHGPITFKQPGPRSSPRLRPSSAQSPRRPFLPGRCHPRRPGRRPRRRTRRFRGREPISRKSSASRNVSRS